MNLLIFSPTPTFPLNHGNRKRIFNIGKYLQAAGHTIHFVYFNQEGLWASQFDALGQQWDTVTVIRRTRIPEPSSTGYYDLDDWYQEDIHTTVNALIDMFDIDAVYLNYIFQSKLLEYVPEHVLKILDTHDVFTDRHKMFEGKEEKYRWFSVHREDEGRALDRADIVVAIQKNEAAYFSELTRTPVRIVNHQEDEHFVDRDYRELKSIGFVGSDNAVNVNAMSAFIDRYFNSTKVRDEVRLVIAGDVCKSIKTQHPNLELLGRVECLEDFYARVDLVINPLTFGTGLKIKSVEALAYGVPILSTAIGFEGIDSGSPYHQVASLEALVAKIDDIHASPDILRKLAALSRHIFRSYSERLNQAISELFDPAGGHEIEKASREVLLEKLKAKERMLIRQHRELEVFKYEDKNARLLEYRYGVLMEMIGAICSHSVLRAPLRKFAAYKKMLEAYHRFRRNGM